MMQFQNERDRDDMLRCLTENMNEEFRATLQYICHRIAARSMDEVLSDSFKSAALDEMAHILFFSDMITKYGGTPRFTAWEVDQSPDLKGMLESDIALEQQARKRYGMQLERFKDYAELARILESVLEDENDHEAQFADSLGRLS